MKSFVIDTNFFINLQRPVGLGATKEEVVRTFVERYSNLVAQHEVQFLSTPESFRETVDFFTDSGESETQLRKVITIQSPSLTTLTASATLFNELVGEMGKRLYKGMRVTEELIREVLADNGTSPREREETYVKKLRAQYRTATREGFLDSTIDLGLIFLAKETESMLISSDKGLLVWARRFGCKELYPEHVVAKLEPLLSKTK